jgi:hypothetical protein
MLIAEKFIYFELQKTGSSYTKDILVSLAKDNYVLKGVHNTYDSIPLGLMGNFDDKLKIGNIRNPWDWYVSLWAFGCMGKGGLFKRVAKIHKKRLKTIPNDIERKFIQKKYPQLNMKIWNTLYSDPNNMHNFRSWLEIVISKPEISIGEGYKECEISTEIGLLSYRYLKLFTYKGNKINTIRNFQSAFKHDKENNFLNFVIRTEHIQKDLLLNSDKLGYKQAEMKKVLDANQKPTNSSIREQYKKYYDDSTALLVKEKERLLIDKYGYFF